MKITEKLYIINKYIYIYIYSELHIKELRAINFKDLVGNGFQGSHR